VTVDLRVPWPDDFAKRYWDAAAEGTLLIQRCTQCGRHQFYPRAHCVHCLTADPDWVEASGRGTLFAFTAVHRVPDPEAAPEVPYIFAVVELEEDVRMTCNLLGAEDRELRCGLPVRLSMRRQGDWTLPCFEPESSSQGGSDEQAVLP
jgi:uncharacterized OB-fold protein